MLTVQEQNREIARTAKNVQREHREYLQTICLVAVNDGNYTRIGWIETGTAAEWFTGPVQGETVRGHVLYTLLAQVIKH